jgi:thiamine biosynthesis lipoprotein
VLRRITLLVALGFAAPCCLIPTGPAAEPSDAAGRQTATTTTRARYLMGTRLSISLPAGSESARFEAAFDEVDRLESILSNWRDTSEVSRLNAGAAGAPFHASRDLLAAVRAALRWARQTGGAFDPTVEPLVRNLGLRKGAVAPPGGGVPVDVSRLIGWQQVTIDEGSGEIRFSRPGIGVDFGGIGKGIALDAAVALLIDAGITEGLLDFGGQVAALGDGPGGEGWAVGIADPERRDRPVATVLLRDASLATSGNSERAITGDGASIGHILDPHRAAPARFSGSVTVLSRNGTAADALSTALFVMGPKRGVEWAESRRIAVLFLWRGRDGRLFSRATSTMAVSFNQSGGGAGGTSGR